MSAESTENYLTSRFGKPISVHTRAEAIRDGDLRDITPVAKEAGFKYPIAISNGVYAIVNEAVKHGGKDEKGVLWDILTMLRYMIHSAKGDRINLSVIIWRKETGHDMLTDMYAVVGPGDNLEPVITIMLPRED